MAKRFVGAEGFSAIMRKFSGANSPKLDKSLVVHNLNSDDASKALSASAGKSINEKILKVDANADGIADNTNLLSGHPESYFVPASDILGVLECKKGEPGGLAPLGKDGKLESIHIPGYADDILEGWLKDGIFYDDESCQEDFEIEGEKGKIYIDLNTNNSYRWDGEMYVKITSENMLEIDDQTITDIWDEMSNLKDIGDVPYTFFHGGNDNPLSKSPEGVYQITGGCSVSCQFVLPSGAKIGTMNIEHYDALVGNPIIATSIADDNTLDVEITFETALVDTDTLVTIHVPVRGCNEYKDFEVKIEILVKVSQE